MFALPKKIQTLLPETNHTRRGFLLSAAAVTGGFAVGFRPGSAFGQSADTASPFGAYLTISADDTVTIISSQFDMGQGAYNGVATLVAEELGARWDQIDVIGGSGNAALYGNLAWGGVAQGTGGSTSMFTSWDRYRMAGAAARHMMIAAAAKMWNVAAKDITVADGLVSHSTAGSISFGELAAEAGTMPVPAEVTLKKQSEWMMIGNADLRRFDSSAKTNGTHDFTIDLKLPGMLTAVMIHPPKFGATVKTFDGNAAKALAGVVDVVETPRGIAVVGEHMWAAIKGREVVTVEWDESAAETRGSDEILAEYSALAAGAPQAIARQDGDSNATINDAAQVIEATYEFPFLAHAAMEPLNAVAQMNDQGDLEIWGGHQNPDLYRHIASQVAGVPPEKVRLHVMKTGGGFGRRGVGDADVIVEAVAVARAIGWSAPVKVQWTRDNDMRGGRYRPAYAHSMRAGLDQNGKIAAWEHHIVGQAIMAGGPFEAFIQNGIDPTSVEGAHNLPYAIPVQNIGLTTPDVGVPVLWWRAVGSTHTAFAVETFLDQLAHVAGTDPLDFRLELLTNAPRHSAVLQLAADKADWRRPVPEGRARGLAMAESFSSYVAQVVELSVEGGNVRVHKVVCAVDCGVAVNPDNVRAQIEGGIGFGLGAIMAEEVTLVGGEVEDQNYDTYTPLRIDAMPEIEVHIVPSSENPTGVGEPGVPPIGPAVANAIYAATGERIRKLPIEKGLQA